MAHLRWLKIVARRAKTGIAPKTPLSTTQARASSAKHSSFSRKLTVPFIGPHAPFFAFRRLGSIRFGPSGS